MYTGGMDIFWLYDNDGFWLRAEANVRSGESEDIEIIERELGFFIYRPLSESDTRPFVSGGLTYGETEYEPCEDEDNYYHQHSADYSRASGLAARVGGGVVLGATKQIQAILHLDYRIGTYKVRDRLPQSVLFGIDVGFGR
jgi:hypothetical protein